MKVRCSSITSSLHQCPLTCASICRIELYPDHLVGERSLDDHTDWSPLHVLDFVHQTLSYTVIKGAVEHRSDQCWTCAHSATSPPRFAPEVRSKCLELIEVCSKCVQKSQHSPACWTRGICIRSLSQSLSRWVSIRSRRRDDPC